MHTLGRMTNHRCLLLVVVRGNRRLHGRLAAIACRLMICGTNSLNYYRNTEAKLEAVRHLCASPTGRDMAANAKPLDCFLVQTVGMRPTP